VAICDQIANIGGLYHILLPKPTNGDSPWEAETYASTGMPVFLQALLDAGAAMERLEATIAGGALVGPVTRQDLDLDIGGTTVDVVRNFLHERGIEIIKSETGGYFSCRLELDLSTLKCVIEPIGIKPNAEERYIRKLSPENVDMLIVNVRPIPQIALKVARIIHSQDYHIKEITNEIKQDQVLAARVLRLSNSALYASPKKIESIDLAVLKLGERRMLQYILSTSMELFYTETENGYSLCKGGLFQHALFTALVAERVAQITGMISPDIAYVGGLLHDIGKVVLDQYISHAYPLFYRRVHEEGKPLIDVEREVLGIDHCEVGYRLADLWGLPENITESIHHHHLPERALINPQLTHIVYLADLLVSRFRVGVELDRMSTRELPERLKLIGLDPDQFPHIIDRIPWKKFHLELLEI